MTKDSRQLLADFVNDQSDDAFRELVARYLDLVYSTALRIVAGDTSLAEDVSQSVFISLAQKASGLPPKVMLGGWLHQHTYYVATRALRAEFRRRERERVAVEANTLMDDSRAHWQQLAPILDEVITQLEVDDRTAILLRYFEQRDFRSVGEALGSTQDAARVRVNRALTKLHGLLAQRSVTLSVSALGAFLAGEAITAAPAALGITISSAALAGAVAAGSGTALTLFKIMATTKFKLAVTALLLSGAATSIVFEHRAKVETKSENQSLLQQIAQLRADNDELAKRVTRTAQTPPLLAPISPASTTTSSPMAPSPRSDLYSLMTNRTSMVKLTPEQAETYLRENGRNAISLLSGFRTSDNPALLQEALQRFPDDPQVNFEAALSRNSSPAERRQALDAFKRTAPDNALAYYLSAADHFKAGEAKDAVQDLVAASSKTTFQDYSVERNQADEEAYRTAGYSVAEAKLLATKQLAFPQLLQAIQLGGNLLDLANSYQQAGDRTSNRSALEMAAELGRRYGENTTGETLIARLAGVNIESKALRAMDANSTYGDGTVQDRINQLSERRTEFQSLAQQADSLWKNLPEQDWISYHSRSATLGEEAALHWLVDKFAAKN